MERTNKEGLTLQEWLAAAGTPDADLLPGLLVAWDDGEDPSDYRAERVETPSIQAPQSPGRERPREPSYDPEAVAKAFIRSHAERAAVDACVSEEDVEISYERGLSGWCWMVRIRYQYEHCLRGGRREARSCGASTSLHDATEAAIAGARSDEQRVR
jgi:hypothetical protein